MPSSAGKSSSASIEGVGLSARQAHYSALLAGSAVPWLEVLADNYLSEGTPGRAKLARLADIYPLVFHCVGFNLGSADPLDLRYLDKIARLAGLFHPAWVSDHLAFCGQGGVRTPDLLPIPYNRRMRDLVGDKISRIVDVLQVPFLVENASYYALYSDSDWSEEEFLGELADHCDCAILLDINNLHVNARNYGFDPWAALCRLPGEKIVQLHLAGHADKGDHIVDTHAAPICKAALELFGRFLGRHGPVPVALERDDNIPPFDQMIEELHRVEAVYEQFA